MSTNNDKKDIRLDIEKWLQKINSPYSSAEETMVWLSKQLLAEYRNNHPRVNYPYSFPKLAKELCRMEVIRDDRIKEAESLRIKKDGFVVILPQNLKLRDNFTLAHEIGHTYFFDRSKSPPLSLIPSHNNLEKKSIDYLERLCNIFAANLLLPEDELLKFADKINNAGCEIHTIEDIAKYCNVGIKTLLIRIKELKLINNPTLFIMLIEQKMDEDIPYGEIIKSPDLSLYLNIRNKALSIVNYRAGDIEDIVVNGTYDDEEIALIVPTKIYDSVKKMYGVGISSV